jgi:hypothetical protein
MKLLESGAFGVSIGTEGVVTASNWVTVSVMNRAVIFGIKGPIGGVLMQYCQAISEG